MANCRYNDQAIFDMGNFSFRKKRIPHNIIAAIINRMATPNMGGVPSFRLIFNTIHVVPQITQRIAYNDIIFSFMRLEDGKFSFSLY